MGKVSSRNSDVSATCLECGEEYIHIGSHWNKGQCERPPFSERQLKIVEGLLLGDGHIDNRGGGGNPMLRLNMISSDFLEWVDDELRPFSTGVRLSSTSEELYQQHDTNDSIVEAVSEENFNDMYTLNSRKHGDLEQFSDWYKTGEKRFPEDLSLTPLTSKLWYCCDGSLGWSHGRGNGNPRATITSLNESDRSDFILDLFREVGFNPTMSGKNIRFPTDETERFLKWMGEPLPDFEYKWDANP